MDAVHSASFPAEKSGLSESGNIVWFFFSFHCCRPYFFGVFVVKGVEVPQ